MMEISSRREMVMDEVPFTDEEAEFWRHVRFGELPERVLPEDRVELTETDARRDIPEPTPPENYWWA